MEPIDHREQRCPHCGYDNRTRDNGPSMLCDTLLAGQYLIGRVLGRGGFGVTYLGYDINLQIKVAIKEYYPSHLVARAKDDMTLSALSGNEESYQKGLERALKESRMAAGLRYVPGVVQVHNVLSANNTVYIVMDYVDGDTLTGYVEKHGGMLTLPEALRLLDPVARALTALHGRKVIHRDVKPDNIMIHRETGEGILLDFGAARIADDSTMSRSAAVVSAGYAPPEQYNQSSLDGRIDQYALAATLMYVLTGRRPPDVMERLAQSNALPAISKLNPSVSPAAEAAILKGMALKADGRYPAVTDLWAALTASASGKKAPAKDKFNLTKTIALALSVTLAGGVLAYYVPRSPLWQQVFGKPQPVAGSGGVGAPQLPTAIPEPVVDEPTAAPTENPYARLFAYYVQSDDTIFIEQYIGSDPEVVVPATIDGFPVSVIGHEAFRNCGDVTSVTLPDSLTELGTYAFAGCRNLKELAIPKSVHTIGPCAFNECVLLEDLVIPEGVALIEDLTFYNCASLKTVTIPESVITIDQSAFSGETHPTLIVVPGSYGELFAQRNRLNYRTIASVTDFEYSATADGGICIDKYIGTADKVMIPDTIDGKPVRQIGPSAFYQCAAIREIVLPESINAIGEHAFSGCSLLSSINIPEGVEAISNRTFSDCTSLNAISLPQSLYTIGDHAFSGCSDLGSITLPENLSHIGQFAFSGCTGLTSITLPPWISCLTDGTFSGCTKLASITFPAQDFNMISHQVFADCTSLTELNLPAALEFIGDDAFSGCTGLTEVTLPEGITFMGSHAFENCSSLTSINIPASLTMLSFSVFEGCPDLTLTVIPGSYGQTFAEEQGIPYAYDGEEASAAAADPSEAAEATPLTDFLYQLTEADTYYISKYIGGNAHVTVPDSNEGRRIVGIDGEAFKDQTQLTSVVVPGSLGFIGTSAFENCTALTDVTLQEGTSNIGASAFSGCTRLRSLALPESIIFIGPDAFAGCPDLVLTVVAGSYGETFAKEQGIAYVYEGATTAPEVVSAAAPATDFEYTKLEDGTIELNSYLGKEAKVVIPAQVEGLPVTKLGNYLFYRNHQMTEVVIPDTVTTIAHKAFYQCTSLREITIPDGVTTIGSYAFHNCDSLTTIVFPEGVETIGDWAFSFCNNLTSVTLPASVTSIGGSATDRDSQLVLTVVAGSYGETYAKKNNIPYVYAEASRPFLPGAVRYEEMPCGDGAIDACYAGMAADGSLAGYVVQASQQGFGGPIQVTVGVDHSGTITGMEVGGDQFAETIKIGTRVQEDFFARAFVGLTATPVAGGNVEAISGATVSSSATIDAAAIAYDYAIFLLAAQ